MPSPMLREENLFLKLHLRGDLTAEERSAFEERLRHVRPELNATQVRDLIDQLTLVFGKQALKPPTRPG